MPRSDVIGHCNKCGSIQRLERCISKASTRVDIQATELEFEEDIHTLNVFSPVIKDICHGSASVETLLSCESFDVAFSDQNIILSISR